MESHDALPYLLQIDHRCGNADSFLGEQKYNYWIGT